MLLLSAAASGATHDAVRLLSSQTVQCGQVCTSITEPGTCGNYCSVKRGHPHLLLHVTTGPSGNTLSSKRSAADLHANLYKIIVYMHLDCIVSEDEELHAVMWYDYESSSHIARLSMEVEVQFMLLASTASDKAECSTETATCTCASATPRD